MNDPKAVQRGLVEEWEPIYAWKQVDEDRMAKLLEVYKRRNSDKLNFSSIVLPKVGDIIYVIKHSGNSMCGRDGVPYAAYRAMPETSAEFLHDVLAELSKDEASLSEEEFVAMEEFLEHFNVQNIVFSP